MTMELEKEWLDVMLRKWKTDHGVVEVMSAVVVPAVGKGVNYGSDLMRISINITTAKGEEVVEKIIVKKNQRMTDTDGNRPYDLLFNTEIKMYTEFLPKMEAMLKKSMHLENNMWANCYGNSENEIYIIFEDLKQTGYRVAERLSGLDVAHARMVLVSLARFHATSKVALSSGLLNQNDLPRYPVAGRNSFWAKYVRTAMLALYDSLTEHKPEWTETARKLINHGETFGEKLAKLIEGGGKEANVINHGDMTLNNVMFRYSTDNNPAHCRFVDFQLSHVASLGCDLAYFFYTSMMPRVRADNYSQLIEAYCSEFEACLKALGSKHRAPTSDEVRAEIDRMGLLSIFACCNVLPIIMNRSEAELTDASEVTNKKDGLKGFYDNPIYLEALCECLIQLKSTGCDL